MRLRTLPLSMSGVLMGIFLARKICQTNTLAIVFLLLTTALLQILSNLSNELGDTLNGTDTAERQGIHYSIQDGEMTVAQLKRLIAGTVVSCCFTGLLMIFFSFGTITGLQPLLFIALGAAAIIAAMKYTLGHNPYGYRAKGDIYVFIFFGLVSTLGSYYICAHNIDFWPAVLPACAMGCFSIAVLNVNNIRDMKTDEKTRVTIAIKLGPHNARVYQTVLILTGWSLMAAYSALTCTWVVNWLHFITMPLFFLHLKGVWTKEDRALDPMLPLLVMSCFVMTLIFGLVS